jgi:hypothetical protein
MILPRRKPQVQYYPIKEVGEEFGLQHRRFRGAIPLYLLDFIQDSSV